MYKNQYTSQRADGAFKASDFQVCFWCLEDWSFFIRRLCNQSTILEYFLLVDSYCHGMKPSTMLPAELTVSIYTAAASIQCCFLWLPSSALESPIALISQFHLVQKRWLLSSVISGPSHKLYDVSQNASDHQNASAHLRAGETLKRFSTYLSFHIFRLNPSILQIAIRTQD